MTYEEAIENAIKATNETLYKWNNTKGVSKLNYTDVQGLLKNWLVRSIKSSETIKQYSNRNYVRKENTLLGQLYNSGYPVIDFDNHNISSIYFYYKENNELAKIIHNLNLKELYYIPDEKPKITNFTTNLLDINFEEIKQIKF